MKPDRRFITTLALAAAATAALLALFSGLVAVLVGVALVDESQRATLASVLAEHVGLLVMAALPVMAAAAAAVQPLYRQWVAGPARLNEEAQVLLSGAVQRSLLAEGAAPPVQALARTINQLALRRDQLQRDIATEVE